MVLLPILQKQLLSLSMKGRLKLLIHRNVSSVQFHASQRTSLMDEEVIISGSGFQPSQPITITGSVKSSSDKINLQSYAHITTDTDGRFDMTKNRSIDGTYCGVDGMGLFWSMKEIVGKFTKFRPADAMIPYKFNFDIFENHIVNAKNSRSIAHLEIERCFFLPDIQRIAIEQDGVFGTLFLPNGEGPFPGIITLIPFSRRSGAETLALSFANFGFATFLVTYFGEGPFPKSLGDIQLEYFEKAMQVFHNMDSVSSNGIGVYGYSQGGHIALAMAAYLQDICAVVSVNGSMGSILGKTTYKKFLIPNTKSDIKKAKLVGNALVNGLECIESIREKPEKQIPIENADADILMIVGEADKNWNSKEYADIAIERVGKSGKNNLSVICYPGAGHCIGSCYIPPRVYDYHGALPSGLHMDFGGHDIKKHVQAQIDASENIISFFKEKLT